jgi:hypothetical protein
MNNAEKLTYLAEKSVGYYSGFGGLEVKKIEYGIEDYCIFAVGAWTGKPEIHKSKIYYETDVPYIKYRGTRVKFDEIIRM